MANNNKVSFLRGCVLPTTFFSTIATVGPALSAFMRKGNSSIAQSALPAAIGAGIGCVGVYAGGRLGFFTPKPSPPPLGPSNAIKTSY